MVRHSPRQRWKGHDLMCNEHKLKGAGRAARTPWRELRKLGHKRRVSRRSPGD
ncbi:hypothetical protein ABT354_35920 [Streptomyces sp. NPDC000594]|uniref:hypothetical protein n=1 Tax=Streptomyces sp. NPDC000594 TaxID=3154261 RepID=UPI0033217B7C